MYVIGIYIVGCLPGWLITEQRPVKSDGWSWLRDSRGIWYYGQQRPIYVAGFILVVRGRFNFLIQNQ